MLPKLYVFRKIGTRLLITTFLLGLTCAGESNAADDKGSDWERYKKIRLKGEYENDTPPVSSDSQSKSSTEQKRIEPKQVSAPTPIKSAPTPIKSIPESTSSVKLVATDTLVSHPHFSSVYSRVPRTTGKHAVKLKNGSIYTLESPDVWDTLPNVRRKFRGFNAPGQLVHLMADGTMRILYDCFTESQPCVPLDPIVSFNGEKALFSVFRSAEFGREWWGGTTLPSKRFNRKSEAQLYVVDLLSGGVESLAHTAGPHDISPA